MIRGLKFTTKGGEGSGHHGHAGRPGQVGGSASSDQPLPHALQEVKGWSDLSSARQSELLEIISVIPEKHLEAVRFDFSHEVSERLIQDRVFGEYRKGTGQILISEVAPASTLLHELGHCVEDKRLPGKVHRLRNEFSFVVMASSSNEMKAVGLRSYSKISKSEFWADSYTLWGLAKLGKGSARKYLPSYREKFPRTAELLDQVWGE